MKTIRRIFYWIIGPVLFILWMLACFAIGSIRVGGY